MAQTSTSSTEPRIDVTKKYHATLPLPSLPLPSRWTKEQHDAQFESFDIVTPTEERLPRDLEFRGAANSTERFEDQIRLYVRANICHSLTIDDDIQASNIVAAFPRTVSEELRKKVIKITAEERSKLFTCDKSGFLSQFIVGQVELHGWHVCLFNVARQSRKAAIEGNPILAKRHWATFEFNRERICTYLETLLSMPDQRFCFVTRGSTPTGSVGKMLRTRYQEWLHELLYRFREGFAWFEDTKNWTAAQLPAVQPFYLQMRHSARRSFWSEFFPTCFYEWFRLGWGVVNLATLLALQNRNAFLEVSFCKICDTNYMDCLWKNNDHDFTSKLRDLCNLEIDKPTLSGSRLIQGLFAANQEGDMKIGRWEEMTLLGGIVDIVRPYRSSTGEQVYRAAPFPFSIPAVPEV